MSTATIFMPLPVQKLLQSIDPDGELAACAIAPLIGMASMLNSTAKQAIQANANRRRFMGQVRWVGDQARPI